MKYLHWYKTINELLNKFLQEINEKLDLSNSGTLYLALLFSIVSKYARVPSVFSLISDFILSQCTPRFSFFCVIYFRNVSDVVKVDFLG